MKHSLETGLESYKALVTEYHTALDLMSDRGLARLDEMVADSLVYAEHIKSLSSEGKTIIDVGSGAGLPGIPLALALPHHRLCLVEKRSRRATFLKLVSGQLGLTNVRVYLSDVGDITDVTASFVTAQAVGTFSQLYCLTRHLHGSEVTVLSRKGETWLQEIQVLERATQTLGDIKVTTMPLSHHGTLVSVQMPGGRACPPLE